MFCGGGFWLGGRELVRCCEPCGTSFLEGVVYLYGSLVGALYG